jgi:phycocyanobilin lyase beta subunit
MEPENLSTRPISALIEAVQQASSSEALLLATRQLACCGEAAAAPVLVEVLGFNNPGAAVAAVDGLIDLGPAAVEALLELDPENYGARAWAVRALAGIGDVRGLDVLIDALGSDVAASVRRAAAKGLGSLKLAPLSAPQRQAIGARCLAALEAATGDGEWVVRYAVAVGLESLAPHLDPPSHHWQRAETSLVRLSQAAEGNPRVVQLRASLALRRLRRP